MTAAGAKPKCAADRLSFHAMATDYATGALKGWASSVRNAILRLPSIALAALRWPSQQDRTGS
ncbi:hypothetical protein ACT9ST_11860 [Sphingobium limneticum]|jgi:hypothetical protein